MTISLGCMKVVKGISNNSSSSHPSRQICSCGRGGSVAIPGCRSSTYALGVGIGLGIGGMDHGGREEGPPHLLNKNMMESRFFAFAWKRFAFGHRSENGIESRSSTTGFFRFSSSPAFCLFFAFSLFCLLAFWDASSPLRCSKPSRCRGPDDTVRRRRRRRMMIINFSYDSFAHRLFRRLPQ